MGKRNADLHSTLVNCISELSKKVGDVEPILDKMAVVLESLPPTTLLARSSLYAACGAARIIPSVPIVLKYKKASMVFPDFSFYQLLVVRSRQTMKLELEHTPFFLLCLCDV